MATDSLSLLFTTTQAQCDGLTAWLQNHGGAAAAVSSITLSSGSSSLQVILKLPTLQLQDLRCLELWDLTVTSADNPAAHQQEEQQPQQEQAAVLPVLSPLLSALTELQLHDCRVNLDGIQALTGLCNLFIRRERPQPQDGGDRHVLSAALPALTRLTTIQLIGELCRLEVIEPFATLPQLQRVRFTGDISAAATLAAMPPTLTSLTCYIIHTGHESDGDDNAADDDDDRTALDVTAATAACLSCLTALQELVLYGVRAFHPVVLKGLTALRTLSVSCTTLAKDYAEPGLDILSRLTCLQSLSLGAREVRPDVSTVQDYQTIAGLPGLTTLNVRELPAASNSMIFSASHAPPPNLRYLACHAQLLASPQSFPCIIAGAPRLQELYFRDPRTLTAQDADADARLAAANLQRLFQLTQLTSLVFRDVYLNKGAWQAVAALRRLKQLAVFDYRIETVHHIVQLTACRSLETLQMSAYLQDFGFCLDIYLQNRVSVG